MSVIGRSYIEDHIVRSLDVLQATRQDSRFIDVCLAISELCTTALQAGGKLLIAGNGGSAGDAQHIAGEFLSRLNFDRAPLAAIALTVDTSVLTATANDYGYEHVFERQVLGLGRPDDVFIGISTSGRSPNILRALEAAGSIGMKRVGFAGQHGGPMAALCDLTLAVPSTSTPMIQQVHITAAHAICGFVEASIYGR